MTLSTVPTYRDGEDEVIIELVVFVTDQLRSAVDACGNHHRADQVEKPYLHDLGDERLGHFHLSRGEKNRRVGSRPQARTSERDDTIS